MTGPTPVRLPPANNHAGASPRIVALDALRGFAVMGILLMNIASYALPDGAYINPAAWGGTSLPDIVAWALAFILVDGKMRALFSLLFGASMLLLIDRAELAGQNGRTAHLRRLFWLFLFGVAHFLLLWRGDILMTYAIVGTVAILFVHREPLELVKWAFFAFAAHFLFVGIFVASLHALHHAALAPGASVALLRDYASLAASIGQPGAPDIHAQIAIFQSGFPVIFAHQLTALPDQAVTLLYVGFDTLGFMLLGMAMLKTGFLTGQWDDDQYRRTARHCLSIGLPPLIALAAWDMATGFATLTVFDNFFAWSFPFRVPVTVGYVALLLLVIRRFSATSAIARVAAVGQMAFSNYLGSSLLMAIIFQGWGLGLFGTVPRALSFEFVPIVWIAMLLWSKPWLSRFAYGPSEWLWRSLAQGRLYDIRRKNRSQ